MQRVLALAITALLALMLTGSAHAATAGQRNAKNKAESYLRFTAFSKSGLVDQLKFDGFSKSEARWAVNHIRVSWNAQAVKKARSYLKLTSFSRQGLRDQLEFDGFTRAQAAYGVRKAYR